MLSEEESRKIDDKHYAQFGYYMDEKRNRDPITLLLVIFTCISLLVIFTCIAFLIAMLWGLLT